MGGDTANGPCCAQTALHQSAAVLRELFVRAAPLRARVPLASSDPRRHRRMVRHYDRKTARKLLYIR